MDLALDEALEAAVRSRDAGSFIAAIQGALRQSKSAFPVLRQQLAVLLGEVRVI